MHTRPRANRYRELFEQFGEAHARGLLDKLQILALTQPEALREFETFIDRQSRCVHRETATDEDLTCSRSTTLED